jgi:hypothetical protein
VKCVNIFDGGPVFQDKRFNKKRIKKDKIKNNHNLFYAEK